MHSYAIFTAKKGRPKTNRSCEVQKKSSDLEVILSLFYLKKLTDEQFEAAKYYESICRKYYNSIDCPGMVTTSFIELECGRVKKHPGQMDKEFFKQWMDIKTELNKVDKTCENLLYKVIIENKLKYELLNPISILINPLKILQLGLEKVKQYRLKAAISEI